MDQLGSALSNAVVAYNQAVGSLESRVLVSARRLNQLGVVDADLDPPGLVEETTRALSAPELSAALGNLMRCRTTARPPDNNRVASASEPSSPAVNPPPRLNMLARIGNLEYDRVLFFSDAIFAIAITLLVLDIKVPVGGVSAATLHRELSSMVSFGISFVVIGLFWIGHHWLSRYIIAFDRGLIAINLLFLGTIAFLPYPTRLLSTGQSSPTTAAVVFYAAWIATAAWPSPRSGYTRAGSRGFWYLEPHPRYAAT